MLRLVLILLKSWDLTEQ